jgi:SAM-dependent methyltransferase
MSKEISPVDEFHSWNYLRHNQRRLEHLASLNLPIHRKSVLEVGAGIGDHTHFFLDRGCTVFATDGRSENLKILKGRYPGIQTGLLDMDTPNRKFQHTFDLVYCYGLLYHLRKPAEALMYLAAQSTGLLLLETCVSFGEKPALNPVTEPAANPSQALSGHGCRPTRPWVFAELKKHFAFVYSTCTQPNHPEFPLDWDAPPPKDKLTRAVFVASRDELNNPLLLDRLPHRQIPH